MEQRGFGDLEAVVMDCVWDYAEPVTVREVFDEISQRRQIAYTTVMSTMDNLYRKRWLQRQRDGLGERNRLPILTRQRSGLLIDQSLLYWVLAVGWLQRLLIASTMS